MLVRSLNARGDSDAAGALRDEAMRFYHAGRSRPAGDPLRSGAALLVGELLLGIGELDAADEFLAEAVANRRAVLGPRHRMTGFAESVRGACLAGLGRDAEAEALLEAGRASVCDERPAGYGSRSLYCLEASRRLAEFYDGTAPPEAAAGIRAPRPAP
jgi:hypothetical protein